jgi:hypothetical protein
MFLVLGNQAVGAELRSRSVDRIRHPNRRPSDSALRSGGLKHEPRASESLGEDAGKGCISLASRLAIRKLDSKGDGHGPVRIEQDADKEIRKNERRAERRNKEGGPVQLRAHSRSVLVHSGLWHRPLV